MSGSILIIGGDGLIGNALGHAGRRAGYNVYGTSRRRGTDLLFLDLVWEIDDWPRLPDCDCVVICAAVIGLNECQRDPLLSYKVNVEGVSKVLKWCNAPDTQVIFLSSSSVFGDNIHHVTEDTPPDAITVYGEHKAIAEKAVLQHGGLVMRITKVLDPLFPRFISWAVQLENGNRVEAFNNLYASPVPVASCAEALLAAIRWDWSGIVHLSGPEITNYFDMARMLAKNLGYSEKNVVAVAGDLGAHGIGSASVRLQSSQMIGGLRLHLPNTETIIKEWVEALPNYQ